MEEGAALIMQHGTSWELLRRFIQVIHQVGIIRSGVMDMDLELQLVSNWVAYRAVFHEQSRSSVFPVWFGAGEVHDLLKRKGLRLPLFTVSCSEGHR